ncbi:Na(+)/H(+) antiporter subunit D [Thalassocella blandensis]|nr:Na(+)/H(+) antiporter subunit D [Thalassocella blandensis]
MSAHLPILQVILPLLAAPTCLLLGRTQLLWMFTCGVSALCAVISFQLLHTVHTSGDIIYSLGGWSAPVGIEYRIDSLNAFVLLLVTSLSTVVLCAAKQSIAKEVPESRQLYFYVAFLLCLAGLLGILCTGDAFNVFVFLEISSLSTYTLIALGRDRRALWASYQYLIMGTIGATFILIGIGLLYMITGTLNMRDLAQRLPDVEQAHTLYTGFAFFIVGVCLKLALFPLHLWLPNAYAYAPSIVTAFLAATATKVAVYVLIRFIFNVFGFDFSLSQFPLPQIWLALGIIGVFAASIVAMSQHNIKRLFAFSSVAQIGYIIMGLSLGTAAGVQAALLHVFNHALMKGAIFLAIAGLCYRLGAATMNEFKGLGKQMPWTMAAIVAGGLSLIGVPLTVGFISKWYLVLAFIEKGWWMIVPFIVIGSLLAVVYVWRLVECAYFQEADSKREAGEAPLSILLPTWILVFANIYFGVQPQFTVHATSIATLGLFGATP